MDGTGTPSCRRYTDSCPRWWYQWLSMIDRSTAPTGIAITSRWPSTTCQIFPSEASSSERRILVAVAMLSSSAGTSSAALVALGGANDGSEKGDCCETLATLPGTVATCSASWPSDIDLA